MYGPGEEPRLRIEVLSTLEYARYEASGDAAQSPYRFLGGQGFGQVDTTAEVRLDDWRLLRAQFRGVANGSDYRSPFDGIVVERLSVRYEDGALSAPLLVEAGDTFAYFSYRTLFRPLKGVQLEVQPRLGLGATVVVAAIPRSARTRAPGATSISTDDISAGASWLVEDPRLGRWSLSWVHNRGGKRAGRRPADPGRLQRCRRATLRVGSETWRIEGEVGGLAGDPARDPPLRRPGAERPGQRLRSPPAHRPRPLAAVVPPALRVLRGGLPAGGKHHLLRLALGRGSRRLDPRPRQRAARALPALPRLPRDPEPRRHPFLRRELLRPASRGDPRRGRHEHRLRPPGLRFEGRRARHPAVDAPGRRLRLERGGIRPACGAVSSGSRRPHRARGRHAHLPAPGERRPAVAVGRIQGLAFSRIPGALGARRRLGLERPPADLLSSAPVRPALAAAESELPAPGLPPGGVARCRHRGLPAALPLCPGSRLVQLRGRHPGAQPRPRP